MSTAFTLAIIGLDSSHAVEFVRRMQAPDCAQDLRVPGLRALTCLRFPSAFQSEEGQDQRQAQLESWGVQPTASLDAALAEVDGVLLCINDPALHRDWFERVAPYGKPVFIDKPLASSLADGMAMLELARRQGLRVCSFSSLRCDSALGEACAAVPTPSHAWTYGPLGEAPAGSSLIWYGVHAVEMLQRSMGSGALAVTARRDTSGVVLIVDYDGGRRGVVELTHAQGHYGGTLRSPAAVATWSVSSKRLYSDQLQALEGFFRGGPAPAGDDDALAVMAVLDAAEQSLLAAGSTQPIATTGVPA